MKKLKVIALVGKSASGKDRILHEVLNKVPNTFHEIISYTTRAPRDGEINGKNYYFVTEKDFIRQIADGRMLEAVEFNNWWYGTSVDALSTETANIGVFNPEGISLLLDNPDVDVCAIYLITAPDKVRMLRQLNREENPDVNEIVRRWGTDQKDFEDLDFDYVECVNETDEDLKRIVNMILNDGLKLLN